METLPTPAPHRADTLYAEAQLQEQLDNPAISRIVISGKFGSGKTMFLNKFFDSDYPDDYLTVRLNPVKYSISSNEDIIRLIKYDILRALIARHQEVFDLFENVDGDHSPKSLSKKSLKELRTLVLLGLVPLMGSLAPLLIATEGTAKLVNEVSKTGGNFLDRLLDFVGIRNKRLNEKNTSEFDQHQIELASLPIIEARIAERLSDLLQYIMEMEKRKQSVLVIDDMDRLDPDSIFRILNVFAHELMGDGLNDMYSKFGFDKIILVCDKNNLKNAYTTRFGGADFDGYFEKFFSSGILLFGTTTHIEKYILSTNIANKNYLTDNVNLLAKTMLILFIKERNLQLRNCTKYIYSLENTEPIFGKSSKEDHTFSTNFVIDSFLSIESDIKFWNDFFSKDNEVRYLIKNTVNALGCSIETLYGIVNATNQIQNSDILNRSTEVEYKDFSHGLIQYDLKWESNQLLVNKVNIRVDYRAAPGFHQMSNYENWVLREIVSAMKSQIVTRLNAKYLKTANK